MNGVMMDRRLVLAFRLMMGWTFLYAGAWQVLSHDFSVASFLAHTKTFHDIYAPLTSPTIAPVLTFLVSWGHLLIGLSLISGLLVRVSGVFGVALLLTYWTAHMDFPYIESSVNLHPRLSHRLCHADWLAGGGECRQGVGPGWLGFRLHGGAPPRRSVLKPIAGAGSRLIVDPALQRSQ